MMPGMAWLSYLLVGLLLLILMGAATLLFWQRASARNKIFRAQKRREVALQEMAALAQRLRQQVSGHQSLKPPASIPTGRHTLLTAPSPSEDRGPGWTVPYSSFPHTSSLFHCLCFIVSIDVFRAPPGGQCVFSVLPVPHTRFSNIVGIHLGYWLK